MLITKKDLQFIHEMTLDYYIKEPNDNLTEQEFKTKCYIQSFAKYFDLIGKVKFEERTPYSPVED